MQFVKPSLAVLFAATLLISCSKKEAAPPEDIDPSDANAIQSVIVIPGGNLGNAGQNPPPSSSSGTGAPAISNNQTTASTSAGNQIQLPFTFTSSGGYTTCYVQVDGATNGYWTVTTNSSVNSGVISIPVNIPSNVKNGQFCVTYCIVDAQGRISNRRTTCIKIKDPLNCTNATASGSEGLTFTQVEMGTTGGTASLDYDTYSIPDRIDIYQGSTWLGGTGTNPNSVIPPLSQCSSPAPGFVGQSGLISFNYDPSKGRNITVVVSGCLGGGTAWDWTLECP